LVVEYYFILQCTFAISLSFLLNLEGNGFILIQSYFENDVSMR